MHETIPLWHLWQPLFAGLDRVIRQTPVQLSLFTSLSTTSDLAGCSPITIPTLMGCRSGELRRKKFYTAVMYPGQPCLHFRHLSALTIERSYDTSFHTCFSLLGRLWWTCYYGSIGSLAQERVSNGDDSGLWLLGSRRTRPLPPCLFDAASLDLAAGALSYCSTRFLCSQYKQSFRTHTWLTRCLIECLTSALDVSSLLICSFTYPWIGLTLLLSYLSFKYGYCERLSLSLIWRLWYTIQMS